MNDKDLSRFISDNSINARLVYLQNETPTVETAAMAVGVKTEQIGKSILFIADGYPQLVIANGTKRIGYKSLAEHLGLSRKKIKLANASQVTHITGYPIGTVPPFGHKSPITTIIEQEVLAQKDLFVGGGAVQVLLRISVDELLRVTGARTLKLIG